MKLYDQHSEHQRIQLDRDPQVGLRLYLDGMIQFTERVEHRYHEALAVVPLLFCRPKSVFIGGGGDGLAARRLLRFAHVERIVVCDYDPAITALATQHPELTRLNAQSLKDERVTVLNEDAYAWLRNTDERFDLVLFDFPDPYYPEAGPLYSVDFYRCVKSRLRPGGMMVTQTLVLPEVTRIVRATVRHVFEHEAYYRPEPTNGFTLGATAPLGMPGPVPDWTQWLSPSLAGALFALPRDVAAEYDPAATPPNQGVAVVKAALATGMGPAISGPHAYRPGATEVYLLAEDVAALSARQVELLLCGLHERHAELIVALEEPLLAEHGATLEALGLTRAAQSYERYTAGLHERTVDTLQRFFKRHDDGSVARIDARTCAPRGDAEVEGLLRRYLSDYSERFFDHDDSEVDFGAPGRYVVTTSPTGQPLALFKLLETTHQPEHVEVEIIYGVGSAKQNLLSIILMLSYLERVGVRSLAAYVPAGVFGKSLTRLGATRHGTMHLFVKDAHG